MIVHSQINKSSNPTHVALTRRECRPPPPTRPALRPRLCLGQTVPTTSSRGARGPEPLKPNQNHAFVITITANCTIISPAPARHVRPHSPRPHHRHSSQFENVGITQLLGALDICSHTAHDKTHTLTGRPRSRPTGAAESSATPPTSNTLSFRDRSHLSRKRPMSARLRIK